MFHIVIGFTVQVVKRPAEVLQLLQIYQVVVLAIFVCGRLLCQVVLALPLRLIYSLLIHVNLVLLLRAEFEQINKLFRNHIKVEVWHRLLDMLVQPLNNQVLQRVRVNKWVLGARLLINTLQQRLQHSRLL